MIGVLLISRSIYPLLTGGIAIHVYYTSRALSNRFNVTILAEKSGAFVEKISIFHVTSLVLIKVPPVYFFSSLVFVLSGLLNSLRKVGRVDIVHAHQALASAVLAFLISRLYRIPFVITCHGSEIRTYENRFIRPIQRFLFRKASCVTTVSGEMRKILMNTYGVNGSKISVIPNGYDEQLISRLIKTSKKEYSSRIVFVGSLRPFKDPITLLMGIGKIVGKHTNISLQIIGDGPLRGRLEAFCLEKKLFQNVIFEGRQPHEKALKAIAESTAFILTSVEEGLPTVLIEAMALGKPIVATAVGGIPELVKNELNGLLIPPRSPEAVAKALERLLNDHELQKRLGKAAAESVKNYSWSKIAEKYGKIYELLYMEKSMRKNFLMTKNGFYS